MRCALVTGVQSCALPICFLNAGYSGHISRPISTEEIETYQKFRYCSSNVDDFPGSARSLISIHGAVGTMITFDGSSRWFEVWYITWHITLVCQVSPALGRPALPPIRTISSSQRIFWSLKIGRA